MIILMVLFSNQKLLSYLNTKGKPKYSVENLSGKTYL